MYVNSQEAAEIIGVDDSYVRRLCRNGTLRAERFGRDWMIKKSVAEKFRDNRTDYLERKPKR